MEKYPLMVKNPVYTSGETQIDSIIYFSLFRFFSPVIAVE